MKVSELIVALENINPELEVEVCVWDNPSDADENTGHGIPVYSLDVEDLYHEDGATEKILSISVYPADIPEGEVMPDDCA